MLCHYTLPLVALTMPCRQHVSRLAARHFFTSHVLYSTRLYPVNMKSFVTLFFVFFAFAGLTASFAQVPSLLSHTPVSNGNNALTTSNVQLTFSQNMSAQAASAVAVRVVSAWRGQLAGTYTGAGTPTITFSPTRPFLLGEHVCVTVTAKATSQAGIAVNHTTAYKYSITDGNGSGSFANANDVPVAYKVRDLLIGDLNGDGTPDVVTANRTSNNTGIANVRLGNGQGGFSSSRDVVLSAIPYAIALGDVNNDGRMDIATANAGASACVRLADGAGGFTSVPDVAVGQAPLKVALQDVNRDNNLDLLTVSASTNAVSLRLGNGQGGFTVPTSPLRAEIPVGAGPFDFAVKDVNADGNVDLVTVARTSTDGTVSVRLGNGAGGFTGTSTVSTGVMPFGMLVQDMNSDGKPDLLLASPANQTSGSRGVVSVRLGDGAGTFAGGTSTEVAHLPGRLVTGDFNADGRVDFATVNWDGFSSPSIVSVRFGNGSGGYSGVLEWPIGQVPGDTAPTLAVADVTGDGVPDLITACNPFVAATKSYNTAGMYLSIRAGKGGQNFAGDFQVASGQGEHYSSVGAVGDINDATLADLNQDQKLDLLLSHVASNNVGVKLNTGNGFVALPDVPLPPGSYNRTIAAGDVNNDGYMDFVTANAGANQPVSGMTASVRMGNGQGGFTGNTEVALGGNPYQIYLQDVNNDGNLDLLATIYYYPGIVVKLGDGLGAFSAGVTLSGAGNQVSLKIVDLNNDGFLDVVAIDTEQGSIRRFLGDGTGTFANGTVLATPGVAIGSASGDLNGDGNVDIVVASTLRNGLPGPLKTYLGNGTGGFGSSQTSTTAEAYGNELTLVDLDGDGILDVALGSVNATLTTYSGNRAGGFTYKTTVPVSAYVTRIVACDINGDGAVDLLSTGYTYSCVSVTMNGTQQAPLATVAAVLGLPNNPLTAVPNPARNTVHLLNSATKSEIYLLDALGRRIRSYATPSLDISGVSPGVYFLQNNGKVVRLVVE